MNFWAPPLDKLGDRKQGSRRKRRSRIDSAAWLA
jgi:hypothetical protein